MNKIDHGEPADEWLKTLNSKFEMATSKCADVSTSFKKLDDYGMSVSPDIIGARIEKYKAQIGKYEAQMLTSWKNNEWYDVGLFDG